MATDNEMVTEIVREMRERCIDEKHSPSLWPYLDRLETAHDREIAELRECLRIIRDNLLSYTLKSEDGKHVNNGGFLSEEFVDDERWRKALEGTEK